MKRHSSGPQSVPLSSKATSAITRARHSRTLTTPRSRRRRVEVSFRYPVVCSSCRIIRGNQTNGSWDENGQYSLHVRIALYVLCSSTGQRRARDLVENGIMAQHGLDHNRPRGSRSRDAQQASIRLRFPYTAILRRIVSVKQQPAGSWRWSVSIGVSCFIRRGHGCLITL